MNRFAAVRVADGVTQFVITLPVGAHPPEFHGFAVIELKDKFEPVGMRWDGAHWCVLEVVDPAVASIEALSRRLMLLARSDWTQTVDCPLSAELRMAWARYRQQLRDLPAQPGFPDVVWPASPT